MLTAEENEYLTRVGPGTPAGELLRRYWHPVAIAADLTPESPTKFVRILVCSTIGAPIAAHHCLTVESKPAASRARITVGFMTPRGIAWKLRRSPPEVTFASR
jgi:hypothetical protein